jgi:hypothetical protein
MAGIWRGVAIAAQPFTRRSRDRTAESATKAQSRCGRTNIEVDPAERCYRGLDLFLRAQGRQCPSERVWLFASASRRDRYVHMVRWWIRTQWA